MIIEHLNGRLRGVLYYKEGIEKMPEEEQEVPFEEC